MNLVKMIRDRPFLFLGHFLLWLALIMALTFPAHALTQQEACANTVYCYNATVTDAYDGDTVSVNLSMGLNIHVQDLTLRLYGIDTPEVRGEEKPQGIIARDYVRDRILGRDVVVQTIKDRTGKYGRLLAVVWVDGVNLNEELVEKGLAEEYLLD